MSRRSPFVEIVNFRCPEGFSAALQELADRRATTVAAVVRDALVRVLRDEGFTFPLPAVTRDAANDRRADPASRVA